MTTTNSTLFDGRMSYLDSEKPCDGMLMRELRTEYSGAALTPFKAAEFSVAPGCRSLAEVHTVREVWFVSSGCGVLTRNNRDMRVGAGDVIYFDSRDSHQLHNDAGEPFRALAIWW